MFKTRIGDEDSHIDRLTILWHAHLRVQQRGGADDLPQRCLGIVVNLLAVVEQFFVFNIRLLHAEDGGKQLMLRHEQVIVFCPDELPERVVGGIVCTDNLNVGVKRDILTDVIILHIGIVAEHNVCTLIAFKLDGVIAILRSNNPTFGTPAFHIVY